MFLVSTPELVMAQCQAGIVGCFPSLNARPQSQLRDWIQQIKSLYKTQPDAPPFGVNLVAIANNKRLDQDLQICLDEQVPLIITSMQPPKDVAQAVHAYGGLHFHDVISKRHAEKAIEAGVDGLVLVCSGAGGHAGTLNPFAFVNEIRRLFKGTLLLAGCISTGRDVLAAQVMGADLAYMGTRFIAAQEANAPEAYKAMIVNSETKDIIWPFLMKHTVAVCPSCIDNKFISISRYLDFLTEIICTNNFHYILYRLYVLHYLHVLPRFKFYLIFLY